MMNVTAGDLRTLAEIMRGWLGYDVERIGDDDRRYDGEGMNVFLNDGESVFITVRYGHFVATGRIPGVPMSPFGHGEYLYQIVI